MSTRIEAGLRANLRAKLREAQDISEAVLDAEVCIGELMARVPTQSKFNATKRRDSAVPSFEQKTKTEIIEEAGFTPKQVQRFQTLAAHPEIVEQAKAEARENDDIVSRCDAVKLWMMQNQLARRNLNDFQRIEIAHKCEDAVRAKANERQSPGVNQYTDRSVVKLPPTSKARDELGSMAGVSGKTYEHAVTVMETAPEPVIEAARCDLRTAIKTAQKMFCL